MANKNEKAVYPIRVFITHDWTPYHEIMISKKLIT